MENNTDVPDNIIPFIRIILYSTFHIAKIDENDRSFLRYIDPKYLKIMIRDQSADYMDALSWALKNPDRSYNKVLPDIRFSNSQCLKIMEIFLKHINLLEED